METIQPTQYQQQAEYEYQHPPQPQYAGLPTLAASSTDDLIKWQQSFMVIIDSMIHRLRGDEFDFFSQQWIAYPERKIMNEIGINAVVLKIFEKVNQFNIMSNITSEQCHEITWQVDIVVIPLLAMNYEHYDLNPRYLHYVWDTMDSCIFLGLSRAINQGERVFLTKTTSRVEHYQEQMTPQNKRSGGFLGGLMGNIIGR